MNASTALFDATQSPQPSGKSHRRRQKRPVELRNLPPDLYAKFAQICQIRGATQSEAAYHLVLRFIAEAKAELGNLLEVLDLRTSLVSGAIRRGCALPSEIAAETGLEIAVVDAAIKKLVTAGVIRAQKREQTGPPVYEYFLK